jgi:hypothetical protein
MAQSDSRRKALAGLFGGVLAIPALALASSALFGSTEPSATAADTAVETVARQGQAPTTTAVTASARDLRRACGRDGRTLVEAEADGTISAVEQAALDALRPICAAEDRPLAPPPAPEPVVVSAASRSDVTTATFDDDSDDDDSWDDDDSSDDDDDLSDDDGGDDSWDDD